MEAFRDSLRWIEGGGSVGGGKCVKKELRKESKLGCFGWGYVFSFFAKAHAAAPTRMIPHVASIGNAAACEANDSVRVH